MKIAGPPCPGCGIVDSFDAIWWTVDDYTKQPLEFRLHCHKCEHVWTERLEN